jgi:hypothetical protein
MKVLKNSENQYLQSMEKKTWYQNKLDVFKANTIPTLVYT